MKRITPSNAILAGTVIIVLAALLTMTAVAGPAGEKRAAAITAALHDSADGWNRGDLDDFMATYDAGATYIGSDGPVGMDRLRGRYEEKYFTGGEPDQQLRFEDITVSPIGPDHALVVGRWILEGGEREGQGGWFTLVWRRTAAGWRIVHDHSS